MIEKKCQNNLVCRRLKFKLLWWIFDNHPIVPNFWAIEKGVKSFQLDEVQNV